MRLETGVCLGLAMLLLVTGLSCGLKRPPRPAKVENPPFVSDLQGDWEGREVVLTGTLPAAGTRGGEASAKWKVRVYHAWFGPGRDPCDGCPISYTGYLEAVPKKAVEGEFVCRVFVEKDPGTHFFEVRLVGPNDALGPRSKRVKLTVEGRSGADQAAR